MSDDIAPAPSLLVRQQRQILTEIDSIRDALTGPEAVAMRWDGTLSAPLVEVRGEAWL